MVSRVAQIAAAMVKHVHTLASVQHTATIVLLSHPPSLFLWHGCHLQARKLPCDVSLESTLKSIHVLRCCSEMELVAAIRTLPDFLATHPRVRGLPCTAAATRMN